MPTHGWLWSNSRSVHVVADDQDQAKAGWRESKAHVGCLAHPEQTRRQQRSIAHGVLRSCLRPDPPRPLVLSAGLAKPGVLRHEFRGLGVVGSVDEFIWAGSDREGWRMSDLGDAVLGLKGKESESLVHWHDSCCLNL